MDGAVKETAHIQDITYMPRIMGQERMVDDVYSQS